MLQTAYPVFKKVYRVGSAPTRLLLLEKRGCPFYTLLISTKEAGEPLCSHSFRISRDKAFAFFLVNRLAELRVSAYHFTDILSDNLTLFSSEYEKGIPCRFFSPKAE